MGFFDNLTKGIRNSLRSDIEELYKMDSDADAIPEKPIEETEKDGQLIGRKSIIDDPFFDQVHQHFLFKNRMSRITNKTLKDVSLRDWLVSSIMQTRIDTMIRFARPQRAKFDMGFKIQKKNSKENLTSEEQQEIANIEDFIYNCGRKDKVPADEKMLFGEFLKLCTRDALTFGHIAVEKIFTKNKALHRFRPLPGEAVYKINQKTSKEIIKKEIESARVMYEQRRKDSEDPSFKYQRNDRDIEYYKYVQMSYDNRVLQAFGDEDLIFRLSNPQNFADSMGYCYSPLELAVINVTNHLNVENYNAQFFTYGYAARGILHLKGTVTQSHLTAFRRQFYNSISGTQHAWRTPIIAGLDDVQWVPLAGGAKEMEYLNYNNHIMRAVCAQFQIDPMEMGLDYLISGNGRAPSQQANNEYKITYSRERGLLPLLMMFEDMVNCDILPLLDPKLADKYEFKFTGYTDETPQTNVALLQAEMTVHSTMNDLLRSAGKKRIDHSIFDLPLNQNFWQLVDKLLTKGEQRELFLGDKSALGKRELAYFPGDPTFMGWQQMLMLMDRNRKQDKMQAEQMKLQQAQQNQQDQREQEKHDIEVNEHHSRQAHAAVEHESLKDQAKQVGAASSPLFIDGKPVANPVNIEDESE